MQQVHFMITQEDVQQMNNDSVDFTAVTGG